MPRINPHAFRSGLPAALLPFFFAAGCQPADMPATFPVSGSVAYVDGQPMKGGTIQLAPTGNDPSLLLTGTIDDNGQFTLFTLKGKRKVPGAVEGQYEVTILPQQGDDHQSVPPVTLPEACTIKPGESTLPAFKVPRPRT
jgi:hypothetical protein